MGIFGCLPLLLILVIFIAFALLGKSIEMVGATAVWLWESFLNFFRSAKKEVRNPWTGITNFEKEDILRSEKHQTNQFEQERQKTQMNEDGTRPKLYDDEDGEYIDYKEL